MVRTCLSFRMLSQSILLWMIPFMYDGEALLLPHSRPANTAHMAGMYLAHLHRPEEGPLQESVHAVHTTETSLLQSSIRSC